MFRGVFSNRTRANVFILRARTGAALLGTRSDVRWAGAALLGARSVLLGARTGAALFGARAVLWTRAAVLWTVLGTMLGTVLGTVLWTRAAVIGTVLWAVLGTVLWAGARTVFFVDYIFDLCDRRFDLICQTLGSIFKMLHLF